MVEETILKYPSKKIVASCLTRFCFYILKYLYVLLFLLDAVAVQPPRKAPSIQFKKNLKLKT